MCLEGCLSREMCSLHLKLKNMCCKSIKDLAGICKLRDVRRRSPAGGRW